MCGIAGVLTSEAGGPDTRAAVEGMRGAIRHRGPDDEGLWLSACRSAAFAHTRLAILDLSPAGHQPMSTPDGRLTITFNGEIFNFRELRRSLEGRGVEFRTQCDTEVILRAYQADGPGCITKLRGMFALAIWDDRERTCLLARDAFGIKPLYYYTNARQLVFASEVRALTASGFVPATINVDALFGYFQNGTVQEPETLVRDVRCLEPGSYAVWREGRLSSQRYWNLSFAPASPGDHAAATRAALMDAVTKHFISDAPVGVFLSGGIDSTALVALAAAGGGRDLRTLSISFPGSPEDEGALARRTAAHFGTRHTDWAVDAAQTRPLVSSFLDALDQPSIDGFNTFAVSRLAREQGLKVVLSGIGGDELFGGYPSFRTVPRVARWNRRLATAGALRPAAGAVLAASPLGAKARRVGDLLNSAPTLANAYQLVRGVFTRAEATTLVHHYTGQRPSGAPHQSNETSEGLDPSVADAVARLEMTRYMRNQLLRDSDTMSMAWGLELRVPFLDVPLVDTITAIPAAIRTQPGKRLLLQAVPEIPEWIRAQPKRGFLFPFAEWIGGEWRTVLADVEVRAPVALDTWYRKWSVFMFERWADRQQRVAR